MSAKLAAEIIKTKGHLTAEGLEKIVEIKARMNKNRIIDATIDMESEIDDDSNTYLLNNFI